MRRRHLVLYKHSGGGLIRHKEGWVLLFTSQLQLSDVASLIKDGLTAEKTYASALHSNFYLKWYLEKECDFRRSFFIGFRHAIEIADNRHSLQRFFIGQGHITKAVEHIRKSGRFRVRHLVLAWTALDAIVSSMAFFIGFFLCFKAYFVVGLRQECHDLITVLSQSFFQVFKGRIHLVRLFLQKQIASIKTQL